MSSHTGSTKPKLLIIEDARLTGRALERTFKSQGYQVSWVQGSAAALELLRQKTFDVIIADLVMAQLQGIELIRELKCASGSAPIVVFSGYLSIDMAAQCIRAGAFHVVEKSEDTSKIIAVVQDATLTARNVETTRSSCPGQKVDAKTLYWRHLTRAKTAWGLTDVESKVLDGIITDKTMETLAVELARSKRWIERVLQGLLIKAAARSRTELINKFWVALRD